MSYPFEYSVVCRPPTPRYRQPISLRRALHFTFVCVLPSFVCHDLKADRPRPVVGCVVLDETGQPAVGARVGFQGCSPRVTTKCNGQFCLPGPARGNGRIVAWLPGYFIAGADGRSGRPITIRLKKHPAEDSPDYRWVDPSPDPAAELNCANCHAEIYRQWAASSHARSAVNKHFLDMFAGTDWHGQPNVGWNFSRDQPEALAVCSACHLPTVTADDPVAEDPTRAAGITREGIHCDYCHKIADSDLVRHREFLGLQHGRDALRLVRPAGDQQIFFGPLDDVDRGRDTFAPLYRSSYYCASCHEGTLFGTKAYETFSEWSASSYARRGIECQQCHMKSDGTTRNIAPGQGGIDRDPTTLATHHFPGSMDESFLRSSVELTLSGQRDDRTVRATVTVRPVNVGHRLPTGSPERHLLLVVRATHGRGGELAQKSGPAIPPSGGVGPREAGNLAGSPGKLYGKLLRGPDGYLPAPFWQAIALESDTRLLPDQAERTTYDFDLADSHDPVRLQARLIYRRFYKSIVDEKSWPDADIVLAERMVEVVAP